MLCPRIDMPELISINNRESSDPINPKPGTKVDQDAVKFTSSHKPDNYHQLPYHSWQHLSILCELVNSRHRNAACMAGVKTKKYLKKPGVTQICLQSYQNHQTLNPPNLDHCGVTTSHTLTYIMLSTQHHELLLSYSSQPISIHAKQAVGPLPRNTHMHACCPLTYPHPLTLSHTHTLSLIYLFFALSHFIPRSST